ncbi:MAG: protein kinase domain-containing protein [bacterium]
MPLSPGTHLGPYEVLAPIGAGGMGEVYRARDTRLGRDVAVKVMPPQFSTSAELRARFELEARAASALSHPNICVIYDIGRDGDTDYIVMELITGTTLGELISSESLLLPRLLEIAIQLADALSAAHEAGITHRDLKPANVMITTQGRVKVLDFGLAKIAADADAPMTSQMPTQPVTQQGSVLGTAPYMSPEQAKGKPLDHRTDIFSLGTILYEMSTGRRPFEGESSVELASAILRDTPTPVSEVNPAMPRHLGRIIRHCLEKEPRERFQTALDVKYELAELKKEVESGEHAVARTRPSTGGGAGSSTHPSAGASVSADTSPGTSASAGAGGAYGAPSNAESAARAPSSVAAAPVPPPSGLAHDARPAPASSAPPQPPSSSATRAGAAPRPRWLVPAAIGLVVVALAAAAAMKFGARGGEQRAASGSTSAPPSATHAPDRKMIVVLPFENLGAAEDAYFAAGMTEEFTSRLARVSGLGVISRTSAVNYDRAAKTMKQIGDDLGVEFVLEGTVRWEKRGDGTSRVRVTPQLIRVADDTHIWSDTFDREIDDLFSVQSEIATNVVRSLGVTLLEPERDALDSRPTQNLEAYQAYVRGKEHERENSPESIRLNIKMFERAVELDSTFALAWAGLSRAHSKIYHFGLDRTATQIKLARAANDRALALSPGLAEAEIAEGYYHYWIHRDFPAALAAFARAEKLLPNDAEVLQGIAFTQRRQGRFEEAIEKLKKALELSPNDDTILGHLGESYIYLNRSDEGEPYVDRALALRPDGIYPYVWKARILISRGELDAARALLESAPTNTDAGVALLMLRVDLFQRRLDRARATLAAFPGEVFEDQWNFLPKEMLQGIVVSLSDDPNEGRRLFEASRARLERELALRPDDHRLHSALGTTLARLGEKEAAIREGRRGVELFPVSTDAMIGPARLMDLAGIYALTGETQLALAQLEELAQLPTETMFALRLDPRWESLRGEPRFQRLLEKLPS